eukprot:Skav235346  [mRNA]  locus=scaffold520:1265286:1272743:- [translate_table: standard]
MVHHWLKRFLSATEEVNLGPVARKALPFTCHMLAGAAASDVVLKAAGKGKKECVFPVGLPEQGDLDGWLGMVGYFDWLDQFLEKNPGHVELSDRKLIEWASKSGLGRPKKGGSNDKPDMTFNNPLLDDGSLKRVLQAVSPALQRSFVIPELKSNLVPTERATSLQKFMGQDFARKAIVVMGEPPKEYKECCGSWGRGYFDGYDSDIADGRKEEERKRLLELRAKKAQEAKNAKKAKDRRMPAETHTADPPGCCVVKRRMARVTMGEEEGSLLVELTEEEKAMKYRTMELSDLTERQSVAVPHAS